MRLVITLRNKMGVKHVNLHPSVLCRANGKPLSKNQFDKKISITARELVPEGTYKKHKVIF